MKGRRKPKSGELQKRGKSTVVRKDFKEQRVWKEEKVGRIEKAKKLENEREGRRKQ